MDLPLWLLYSYYTRKLESLEAQREAYKTGKEDSQDEAISLTQLAAEMGAGMTPLPAGTIDQQVAEIQAQRGR